MAKKKEEAAPLPATKADAAGVPAAMMGAMEQEAGKGHENADIESYGIPFLRVVQSNSPVASKADGEYVEGAEAGMLINTVTKQLYDGAEGVLVVPCHYRRSMVQWKDIDQGGGFCGDHALTDPIVGQAVRNDKGKDELPDGTHLVDTRSHSVLILDPETLFTVPAVLALSSTQTKKSKAWMTMMAGLKVNGPNGPFNPPMYAQVYRITTVPEKNDKGSWFGTKIVHVGFAPDMVVMEAGKVFHSQIDTGVAKPAYETAGAETTDDGGGDTEPF